MSYFLKHLLTIFSKPNINKLEQNPNVQTKTAVNISENPIDSLDEASGCKQLTGFIGYLRNNRK